MRGLLNYLSLSPPMHGEFLRLLFLQAHRETTAHFTAIGMPATTLRLISVSSRGILQWPEKHFEVGLAAEAVRPPPKCGV